MTESSRSPATYGTRELADILEECGYIDMHSGEDDFKTIVAALRSAPSETPRKLWLWKNFVDGRPEYWAFDNAYPTHGGGDPQTLGEPCGYAIFKESTVAPGRKDVPESEVIAAIKRTSAPSATPRTSMEIAFCPSCEKEWKVDQLSPAAIATEAERLERPDPVKELCAYIKDSIRFCDHGYIHITCGRCTAPGLQQ